MLKCCYFGLSRMVAIAEFIGRSMSPSMRVISYILLSQCSCLGEDEYPPHGASASPASAQGRPSPIECLASDSARVSVRMLGLAIQASNVCLIHKGLPDTIKNPNAPVHSERSDPNCILTHKS
jgi:hypothetical protein